MSIAIFQKVLFSRFLVQLADYGTYLSLFAYSDSCDDTQNQVPHKIGKSFRKVKNEMYTKHVDGFYVRAKSNLCTPDITIKYISRYLGGPTIATSRIDKYDGEFVTFHCTRHDDNQTITECIPALDFIKR